MKRQGESNPSTFRARHAAWVLVLLSLAAAAARADAPPPPPSAAPVAVLPETSTQHGLFRRQVLRFSTSRRLTRAQQAIAAGDFQTAAAELEAILKGDPGHNRARLSLIETYDKLERWNDGMAMCDSVLKDYPDLADVHLSKAFMAARAERVPEGILALEQVLRLTPKTDARHRTALVTLPEWYYRSGNHAAAQAAAREHLAQEDTLPLRLLLAECAIHFTNGVQAIEHLDAALRFPQPDADKGEIYLKRGYLHYDLRNLAAAERDLAAAADLVPDRDRRLAVMRQRAETAMCAGRHAEAAALFRACLREGFEKALAAAHLEALSLAEQWNDVIAAARDYLARDGVVPSWRARLLRQLFFAHKALGDDLSAYLAAARLAEAEADPALWLEMAESARRTDQTAEAIRLYRLYLDKRFEARPALACHYLLKSEGRIEECEPLLVRVRALESLDVNTRAEAAYELAQIYRLRDRLDEYFPLMEEAIRASREPRRLYREAAMQLHRAGRREAAAGMFVRSMEGETDSAILFETCRDLADIHLSLRDPEKAFTWLEKARTHGTPDWTWQSLMARVEYARGQFEACADRLLALPEAARTDGVHLYIGFSFYRLGLPGLALHHFDRIADPDALDRDVRYNLFSNRAYLLFDQDRPAEAREDALRALAMEPLPDMAVLNAKALARLGRHREARDEADRLLAGPLKPESLRTALAALKNDPRADLRARWEALVANAASVEVDVLELSGVCAYQLADNEDAANRLARALERDPNRAAAHYVRGLALARLDRLEDADTEFRLYRETARPPADLFWADLGVLQGRLAKYDQGTEALHLSLDKFRHDIDTLREAGYQYLKWPSNAAARAHFARAIDTYTLILPYLEEPERTTAEENRTNLKREYTKLDKVFGGQAYFSKTDYDFPTSFSLPSAAGALPSQAGVEVNWRPPRLGFRNERTFDVFGRVLSNFEPDSWALDEDSYQGGVGVRWKPFKSHNVNAAFERLFKIGDNSEDNWLLRAAGVNEWGEKPKPGRPLLGSLRLFAEAGIYLDDPQRWYYYLDGRVGGTFTVRERLLLTLPQALVASRYESDDATNLGTYTMVGLGLTGRVLEPERRYVTERWYVDAYLHYVWGWFKDEPGDLRETAFDGIVFGVNFVK